MSFISGGTAFSSGASGAPSRTVTIGAGVTPGKTVLIVAQGSVAAPATVTVSKTGATFSSYVTTGSWTAATANSLGMTPTTTSNMWTAVFKGTGLTTGDVVTVTCSSSPVFQIVTLPFDSDLIVGAYGPRAGSAATTTAPALTVVAGQASYAYFVERSASITLTGVSNTTSGALTPVYTQADGATAPVCNTALVAFTPAATTTDTTVATYSGAIANGAGFTFAEVAPVTAAGTATLTLTGSGAATGPGTAGTATLTLSGAATARAVAAGTATLTLTGTGAAGAPVVVSARVGGVTTGGFKANVDTTNATGVRLAVSTSSAMTSPVYNSGSTTAVNSQGCATLAITGLAADTDYWWQFEVNGTLTGPTGRARTLPTGATAGSYSFIATSCQASNSNTVAFDNARQRTNPTTGKRALFNVHLGDLHYANISSTSPGAQSLALNMAAMRGQFAQSRQGQLFREIPTEYTMSDHDFGQDQAAGSDGNGAYYYQAWRNLLAASYPLVPDSNSDVTISGQLGIYRTWTVGQICYILTDGRGYMSDVNNTDNASKTKLGATQKAWLKATALAAVQAGRVVVWLHEDGWNNPSTFTNDDTWAAYTTERAEIANYFTANGIASRLLYICGDWHILAADDGSHNTWGGFPLIVSAPWDQNTGKTGTGAVFSQGTYPASTGPRMQMYGWFDVTDVPGQVTVAFTGYDATTGTDSPAMTMSKSFATGTAAAGSATLTLSGTAGAAPAAAGTATFTLSGTGAARATASGTATLTLTGSGTAASSTAGAASLTLTGTGAVTSPAAATATIALTGTGASSSPAAGSGAATITLTATAAAAVQPPGTATLTLTGTGTASAPAAGTATLTFAATGNTGGSTSAAGTAILNLSGSGTTRASSLGSATIVLTGNGTGRTTASGTAHLILAGVGVARSSGGAAPTPLERTFTVKTENRVLTVHVESRTFAVPAENRLLEA